MLQALPFLFKEFITEEVAEINRKLKENGLDYLAPVEDPSDSIQLVMNYFNDWYNHLRQPIASTQDLEEIAEKTFKFQQVLKLMFPTKSGMPDLYLVSAVVLHCPDLGCLQAGERCAWRIIKFHILQHIPHHILLFGWIENSSCQAGEHCHRFYIKLIKKLTNNKVD